MNRAAKMLKVASVVLATVVLMPTAQAQAPLPTVQSLPDNQKAAGWVMRYFEGTRSGDASRWASAFAENAVFSDPVGLPVVNGRANIEAAGRNFTGLFSTVGLREEYVHVVGLMAVAKWRGTGTLKSGQSVSFQGINHFTFNADGTIAKLEGFWDPSPLLPK